MVSPSSSALEASFKPGGWRGVWAGMGMLVLEGLMEEGGAS